MMAVRLVQDVAEDRHWDGLDACRRCVLLTVSAELALDPEVDVALDVLADIRGPHDGEPVVFFSGTPGSRLMCPDERATDAAGVRPSTRSGSIGALREHDEAPVAPLDGPTSGVS